VGAGHHGVRRDCVSPVESQGKVMSLFDPAATAKSVHDTIDAATEAIPADAKYALIVDATVSDGNRPNVQGYLVA
jgi:hypothetical protein